MTPAFHIITTIFKLSIVRYFILAGIPYLLFYIFGPRWFTRNKIQQRQISAADIRREILHSTQTNLVLAIIAWFILYTPFVKHTLVYQHMDDYPFWWFLLSIPVSLIIHDTYFYWMHRLLHDKHLFRYTHLVHHKSANPSPFSSYSFHFIESWTEGAVLLVIVLVIPIHPMAILAFNISAFLINVYGHLGYEIMPKRLRNSFLFGVINTSVFHNLHHSRFKGNYGLYFRWWDRLMGTENPDYVKEYDRVQTARFGSPQQPASDHPATKNRTPENSSSANTVSANYISGTP